MAIEGLIAGGWFGTTFCSVEKGAELVLDQIAIQNGRPAGKLDAGVSSGEVGRDVASRMWGRHQPNQA